jgi:hypothetical protein
LQSQLEELAPVCMGILTEKIPMREETLDMELKLAYDITDRPDQEVILTVCELERLDRLWPGSGCRRPARTPSPARSYAS